MKIDERALKAAMKKMGIQSQDISAKEVIIRTDSKDIIIKNPQITKVNMMGQDTFQIMGAVTEKPAISKEDIKTVIEQTGVDEKTALKALESNDGDLAAAIMQLRDNNGTAT